MIRWLATIGICLFMSAAFASATERAGQSMVNRLHNAASPYLRQHATNPVDWYEWGAEAFERARRENKPIFLSVGYSTCHWCHVMERESFENPQIAKLLNRSFISIKVDRERRPDVDETYMLATQILTGQGGWPNSVFLTPERKPFYAGTYFPAEPFARLLGRIATLWRQEKTGLSEQSERISAQIEMLLNRRLQARQLSPALLAKAEKELLSEFDEFNGGFGEAPKFPHEPLLMFLLQRALMHDSEPAKKALLQTLDAMLDGGIHDQLGGGFHRYATDNEWLVPHFEKMLYNQAQMVRALTGAYRLTGRRRYADAAEKALAFVERHMTSPKGGFYSAWDADSEGEEGTFYVWTPEQLEKALGKADAGLAAQIFGVTEHGNFERHTSILHRPDAASELAANLKLTASELAALTERLGSKLLRNREQRPPPHLDDKIVLSWNGMMATALFEAALALDKPVYAERAARALDFIEQHMRKPGGGYFRSFYDGTADQPAQQEDYAFLAMANLLGYDATGEAARLKKAERFADEMDRLFLDRQAGDYFMTAAAETDSFTRGKARSDNAAPSGNAAALEVLVMLSGRSHKPEYAHRAEQLLAALSGLAAAAPQAAAYTLRAVDMMQSGEAGRVSYFAKGQGRAKVEMLADGRRLSVRLQLAPGWHINADRPASEDLVATRLLLPAAARGETKVVFPAGVRRKLPFAEAAQQLFEGDVAIEVRFAASDKLPRKMEIELQACSESLCLEPERAGLFLR